MLAPEYPAAVVAGNVETSQAITGALYAALGEQAEGAGTMNNVTFGNARCQYYETLASGAGAGGGFDGAPVVQTHMTNSRLTDPEVLEWRLPVRVEQFSIRRGSGGAGRWRGGDGALRKLRFTEAVTVSTLSGRRRVPPYGMAGGEPGARGAEISTRYTPGVDASWSRTPPGASAIARPFLRSVVVESAGADPRILKRAGPDTSGNSSPITAVAVPAVALNSRVAGVATASIVVYIRPRRIAVRSAAPSSFASPVGGRGRTTWSANVRKVASYEGMCRRRPRAPSVSIPKPPCAS
jgi:hypothetical protein